MWRGSVQYCRWNDKNDIREDRRNMYEEERLNIVGKLINDEEEIYYHPLRKGERESEE